MSVNGWNLFFFDIKNGVLERVEKMKTSSSGFWNTVEAADFDQDGDTDLFLGNHGVNSLLTASKAEPIELYVKDFDGNNQQEPILTYYQQNKKYVLVPKDDLTNQLTFFRKQFLDYQSFAKADFETIFTTELLAEATHQQVNILSHIYLENEGEAGFVLQMLPDDLQLSPIQSFAVGNFSEADENVVLAVGNFSHNTPVVGKMDNSFGHYWNGTNKTLSMQESGFFVKGDARDIAVLEKERLVVVVMNDGAAKVFSY